jgi:hypothetical protein
MGGCVSLRVAVRMHWWMCEGRVLLPAALVDVCGRVLLAKCMGVCEVVCCCLDALVDV